MNKPLPLTAWWCSTGLVCVTMVLTGGCQLYTNPFVDSLGRRPAPSTASVSGIVAAQTSPTVRSRSYAVVESPAISGAVSHGPLYFEDSFEDAGTDADGFALTGEDFLLPTYWQARLVVNALLFPVHALITPPWTAMVSDGHPSGQVSGWQRDAAGLREELNTSTP